MICARAQTDLLAQIESRYEELLEGLTELEARVATTLEIITRRSTNRGHTVASPEGADAQAGSAEIAGSASEPAMAAA
jgi:hypothetical protein